VSEPTGQHPGHEQAVIARDERRPASRADHRPRRSSHADAGPAPGLDRARWAMQCASTSRAAPEIPGLMPDADAYQLIWMHEEAGLSHGRFLVDGVAGPPRSEQPVT